MGFKEHTCPRAGCGVTFAILDGFDVRRREDHGTFYCPNGHTMSYPGETSDQQIGRLLNDSNAAQSVIAQLRREVKKLRKPSRKAKPAKKAPP
jgi:hypothetical protein